MIVRLLLLLGGNLPEELQQYLAHVVEVAHLLGGQVDHRQEGVVEEGG
mgnify:CR=1 FL=1